MTSGVPVQCGTHQFSNYYRPQTKFAKVMFLHLSVSHSVHGGEYLGRYSPLRTMYTPQTRYTPQTIYTPQVHPPGPGTPPRTRYTPQTRYTPSRDQVHPLGPHTPPTRYTPNQVHPLDQVHPPGPGTPHPGTRYTPWDQVQPPPADGYCCGRYASY